jgi:hypothetical protein
MRAPGSSWTTAVGSLATVPRSRSNGGAHSYVISTSGRVVRSGIVSNDSERTAGIGAWHAPSASTATSAPAARAITVGVGRARDRVTGPWAVELRASHSYAYTCSHT